MAATAGLLLVVALSAVRSTMAQTGSVAPVVRDHGSGASDELNWRSPGQDLVPREVANLNPPITAVDPRRLEPADEPNPTNDNTETGQGQSPTGGTAPDAIQVLPAESATLPAPTTVPLHDDRDSSPYYELAPVQPGCDDGVFSEAGPYCLPPCEPVVTPRSRYFWARGEFLLWWTQGGETPPLVTTSTAGTNINVSGVLGQPNTSILFGNDEVNDDMRWGGRVTLGCWLRADHSLGVEANYMRLGQQSDDFSSTHATTPILARPFYDIQAGAEDAIVVAHPTLLDGSVTASAKTDFQGAEILLRHALFQSDDYRVDALGGCRFNRLTDDLLVSATSVWKVDQGLIQQGTTRTLVDSFHTENDFYGGQFGTVVQWEYDRWSVELLSKIALGNTRSTVLIDGTTTTTLPGGPSATTPGGVLAQPTNMGQYRENQFCVIPELGVTLGYEVLDDVRLTFGYTFLFWSAVARPGDQIDRNVNPTQFPPGPLVGAPQPEFSFATTGFWAQGMNFGLDCRF